MKDNALRIGVSIFIGTVGAIGAKVVAPDGPWFDLAILGAAVMVGEILMLRPIDRAPLPLSYAVVLVLARVGTPTEAIAVVLLAQFLSAIIRERGGAVDRFDTFLERCLVSIAAILAYRGATDLLGNDRGTWPVLLALAASAIAMMVSYETVRMLVARRFSLHLRGRSADIALVSSGMLMAIGYVGIDGHGRMGAWALALFSIPLIAAWYSFERLHGARKTYWQTIDALSIAPEIGGMVHPGHAEHVVDLSMAMAERLDLSISETETLRAAAYLHHIGEVCMDSPEVTGHEPNAADVSMVSAAMLRETGHLTNVGDVVADEVHMFRSPSGVVPRNRPLSGQILKIASTYDDVTLGDDAKCNTGMTILYSAPAYVYDPRVLSALEQVLKARGLAVTIGAGM